MPVERGRFEDKMRPPQAGGELNYAYLPMDVKILDEHVPLYRPRVFLLAGFVSIFFHVALLSLSPRISMVSPDKTSVDTAVPKSFKITINKATNTNILTADAVEIDTTKPEIKLSHDEVTTDTSALKSVEDEILSDLEETPYIRTENSKISEQEPQTTDRDGQIDSPKNQEVTDFSFFPEILMSDIKKLQTEEDRSPTLGSGTIFDPNLRKRVQEARRFNRGQTTSIEELNNGWSKHTDEIVSAGDKCFVKKQILGTTGEFAYYRTACIGKKTESDSMADSLRAIMKRKNNLQN